MAGSFKSFQGILKWPEVLSLFIVCLSCRPLTAQVINYSTPDRDNIRSTDFQIIGKCGRYLLIYKNEFDNRKISFYNASMQLVRERELDFLPKNILQTDFIAYPAKMLLYYQYHHKGSVVCEAVILDSTGSPLGKPVFIDKTDDNIPVLEKDKWYGLLVSGNRQRMMIYQMRLITDSLSCRLTSFLIDTSLHILHKSLLYLPMKEKYRPPSHLILTNGGSLLFTITGKENEMDPYYNQIILLHKPPLSDTAFQHSCWLNGRYAGSSLLLQPDENQGRTAWLLAFLYGEKKRNITGLYALQYDYQADTLLTRHITVLGDSLKQKMKGKNHSIRDAFDNSQLNELVVDKGGGALLIAEDVFTDGNGVDHHGNIALMELDQAGRLLSAEAIVKDQGTDLQGDFASYLLVNTGDALHLLFNKAHKVSRFLVGYLYLIIDYRYGAGRQLKELPLFRRLDRKYHWSPSNGKQISNDEVVIPCVQGGSLRFAKITYLP